MEMKVIYFVSTVSGFCITYCDTDWANKYVLPGLMRNVEAGLLYIDEGSQGII